MCGGGSEADKAKNAQYNEQMNDPNFKGVPMDKGLLEFSEGKAPFSDRHCTDVCCCIVFCVYIFHCSLIALDGFANGDPLAYFYMYDMDGRACGTDGTWQRPITATVTGHSNIVVGDTYEAKDYKYLYLWAPLPGNFQQGSCMSECLDLTINPMTGSVRAEMDMKGFANMVANGALYSDKLNDGSTANSNVKQLPCMPTKLKGNSPSSKTAAGAATTTATSMCISQKINLWRFKTGTGSLPAEAGDGTWQAPGAVSNYNNPSLSLSDAASGNYADWRMVYPSKPFFGRLCFPESPCMLLAEKYDYYCSEAEWNFPGTMSIDLIWEKITLITEALGIVSDIIADIKETKWYIIGTIFLSMAVGFLFMLIMQLLAACLIWTFILTIIVGFTAATAWVWMQSSDKESKWDTQDSAYEADQAKITAGTLSSTNKTKANRDDNYWFYGFFPMAVISLVLWIGLCCFYKKIQLIIKIIQTAADFVTDVWTVMLIPIVALAMFICWVVVGGVTFMYVFTVGKIGQAMTPAADGVASTPLPYTAIERTEVEYYNIGYFFFLILWVAYFIDAINQFCIASTAAIWYFSDKDPHNLKKKKVVKPVGKSFYRVFRYHPGTIAFGAFLLAVVKMLQIIMNYVEKQMKSKGKMNKVKEFIIKCLKCCLKCLERFIKFLNKNAYIQCAIQSSNFCVSAKEAFFLILRNPVIFALAGGLGKVFMALGKWFITVGTTLIMYKLLKDEYWLAGKTDDWDISRLMQPYLVLFFICVLSQLIGTMFMEVWGMAVDTILQCYCLDADIQKGGQQDGSPVFSKYTPVRLQEFMNSDAMKAKPAGGEAAKQ